MKNIYITNKDAWQIRSKTLNVFRLVLLIITLFIANNTSFAQCIIPNTQNFWSNSFPIVAQEFTMTCGTTIENVKFVNLASVATISIREGSDPNGTVVYTEDNPTVINGIAVFSTPATVTSGNDYIIRLDNFTTSSNLRLCNLGTTNCTSTSNQYLNSSNNWVAAGNGFSHEINATLPAAPEIDVTGLSMSIPIATGTTQVADDTDFGDVLENGGTDTHTFTIENTGNADLNISSISIDNTTDFSITQAASAIVAGASNTTFTVTFDPASVGNKTATITIANNE